MPSSQPHQISSILNVIIQINPDSVLDIGAGFGKYGVLCREYLDVVDGNEEYKNFSKKIDGIEVFEEYITPIHKYVYDNIYIGNVVDIIDEIGSYDLVLLIDVLEHFRKDDGKRLISKLLSKNKGIIVSVPKNIGHQGAEFNNKHETHRAQWSGRELLALGNSVNIKNNTNHIVYLGEKNRVGRLKKELMVEGLVGVLKRYTYNIPGVVPLYNYLLNRSNDK